MKKTNDKEHEALASLSVVIPTFNCAEKLERALESVKWAHEIIVVDMGSVDTTLSVAKKFNAKIFNRIPDNGNFDQNRKYGMEKASSEWIMKLDSDEEVTPELTEQIKHFLVDDKKIFNGIYLYNKIVIFGHEVKHGFVKRGSNELRIVRNGFWKYDPYKFHQQISVTGQTTFLEGKYVHYNFYDVSEFIEKTNKYTTLDAKIMARKNHISVFDIFFAPFKSFIKLFILQIGFLDGLIGFELSFLFASYNLIEKIKIRELQND